MPRGKHGSFSSPQEYGLYILRSSYKSNARRKGLAFELTAEDIEYIVSLTCEYCGAEPQKRSSFKHITNKKIQVAMEGQHYYANGIDRVDNQVGYTLENCVPCCSACNSAKGSMPVGEWLNLIDRIYAHQHFNH